MFVAGAPLAPGHGSFFASRPNAIRIPDLGDGGRDCVLSGLDAELFPCQLPVFFSSALQKFLNRDQAATDRNVFLGQPDAAILAESLPTLGLGHNVRVLAGFRD